jgi:hypothetical protein
MKQAAAALRMLAMPLGIAAPIGSILALPLAVS